jgi:hypothetical protein
LAPEAGKPTYKKQTAMAELTKELELSNFLFVYFLDVQNPSFYGMVV